MSATIVATYTKTREIRLTREFLLLMKRLRLLARACGR